jgi:electron transfer flavoprotein beta subunit
LLIIALLKAVPARTTQTSQLGGVLNREAMELVLNPHDAKALEAADYIKRRAGGKIIAMSMGPDSKLIPLIRPLFDSGVSGVDEEYVLSDRRMAGSDTLATSYAVALGVKTVVDRHTGAIRELVETVRKSGYSDAVRARASELYDANMLPNRAYSTLPSVRDSIIQRFLGGGLSAGDAVTELMAEADRLSRFIVVAGIKTTDGETGSVGPQVAEGVSELLGATVPHATYVEDFDLDPIALTASAQRKIGYLSQRLEMKLPALLTVSKEYRPREAPASFLREVRHSNYKGKVLQPFKLIADDLGADPKRLGLAGSPTIVGPGIDIGKAPVQKALGSSLVFLRGVAEVADGSKRFGPFAQGDLVPQLSVETMARLQADSTVGVFGYSQLAKELLA